MYSIVGWVDFWRRKNWTIVLLYQTVPISKFHLEIMFFYKKFDCYTKRRKTYIKMTFVLEAFALGGMYSFNSFILKMKRNSIKMFFLWPGQKQFCLVWKPYQNSKQFSFWQLDKEDICKCAKGLCDFLEMKLCSSCAWGQIWKISLHTTF